MYFIKVEQTAKEVLEMFPDLELAIEEEEPKLAADFFNIVKGWVAELREMVSSTQKINKASMNQVSSSYFSPIISIYYYVYVQLYIW